MTSSTGTAETLLAQAVAAFNKGDMRTAADRFERAATTLAAARPADAVLALESATRLRLMLDQPRHAALAIKKAAAMLPDSPRIAHLQAELADKGGDLAERRAAWQAFCDRGNPDEQRAAHVRLAYLAREANDPAATVHHFAAAVGLATDLELRAEIQLELAIAKTTFGDHAGATAVLDAIKEPTLGARIIGQRGIIALVQGDHERALELGEQARGAAVEADDVMTYLAAASLIAIIHEQADRLVEAYDTYIRARESLIKLLGDHARGLVQPAIELFEERLGKAKFDAVWQDWVSRARQRVMTQ